MLGREGRADEEPRGGVLMGVDILDLMFGMEKRFGIRIRREEWIELMERNDPPDVTAGELFGFVMTRAGRFGYAGDEMDAVSNWLAFQREVSDSLGVEPGEVEKGKRIIRDLGAG
jgi:hypothetical protein